MEHEMEDTDQLHQDIQDLKYKLRRAEESIRHKTKVIKDIEERLREAALETDPVKMRVMICRALGVSTLTEAP
jgi:chromosome segregation ATPase